MSRQPRAALLAALLTAVMFVACRRSDAILGKWEYRQANAGMPSGVDAEGERLQLQQTAGRTVGTWLGLERMGEHGLYYTAVDLEDVVLEGDQITFTVPGRSLFAERPPSVAAARSMSANGSTRIPLRLWGRLENGRLVLQCASSDFSCPDDELTFERGGW